ncbi:MAG: hypothetical protein FJ207_15455, partial [Gemmatimonadetes bacterium]|nr:hypothetical protein [Gemmatimonadota bacterium]
MKLEEVRPRHVRQLVDRARAAGRAPRTIRNIYGIVQVMFRDAVMEDLIQASPCILTERELGEIVDKDPEWRGTAIYSREELVSLVSDPRVREDCQVLYALEGIGGLRHGEAAGLRWRHYESDLPLDALQVARSYKNKRGTKTQRARRMPVHPVLAEKLRAWKAGGWVAMMGREATPDDLVCPCPAREQFPAGRMRDKNYSRKCLMADFKALRLRHRRGHDLRRTMISLARRDGARRDLLEICTHTPSSSHAIDLYTEFEWKDLCGEVAKLRLTLARPTPSVPEPLLSNPTIPSGASDARAGLLEASQP